MKPTDACYTLQDPSEVMAFLDRLVLWGGTHSNVWHAKKACLGWKLRGSCAATDEPQSQPRVAANTPSGRLPAAACLATGGGLPGIGPGSTAGQAGAARAAFGARQHLGLTPTEASAVGARAGRAPLSAVATAPLRKSLEERRISAEYVRGSGAGSSGLPGGSPIAGSPVKGTGLASVPQVQAASAVLAFKSLAGGSRAGSTGR